LEDDVNSCNYCIHVHTIGLLVGHATTECSSLMTMEKFVTSGPGAVKTTIRTTDLVVSA